MFTAGRGPLECAIAVKGVQQKFKKYLDAKNVGYEIVKEKKGGIRNAIETIVFRVWTNDRSIVEPWVGSIQWICQSPIRKFNKRKNWFVKCEEVFVSDKIEIDMKDVTVQSFRASGPGGQHRNKVETAIRLIHNSTGLTVTATDSKSQLQNKKNAWLKMQKIMKSKNEEILIDSNTNQWTTQLQIERGSPAKTFIGEKFKEKK